MKAITPYLLRFILTALILTILFRISLSYTLENELFNLVIICSSTYGALMFVAGWVFGRKDGEYLPIFDIGFRFHLSTYIVHNLVSYLWVGLGYGSHLESIDVVSKVAAYWGIFLIIHFIFYLKARRQSIDNLNKEDLFD